ncbi:hypothetical protein BT63DRAFT_454922 [Microthyrium microscopicum]|uniref:Uncharacterized protein n=1 Tax=Microthyrium microscopicum TaxID=703497 RepID=A0A6A6UAG1_9PEZI|nr:hypothetical protein BT63DRAFT_454922 [Microthyrium microscopicum]
MSNRPKYDLRLTKHRRFPLVMTVMGVCVVFGGTLYGASLKQDIQIKEIKEARATESFQASIDRLESKKMALVQSRDELKAKIQSLRARAAEKAAKNEQTSLR